MTKLEKLEKNKSSKRQMFDRFYVHTKRRYDQIGMVCRNVL